MKGLLGEPERWFRIKTRVQLHRFRLITPLHYLDDGAHNTIKSLLRLRNMKSVKMMIYPELGINIMIMHISKDLFVLALEMIHS
jgi:hypothetical protein